MPRVTVIYQNKTTESDFDSNTPLLNQCEKIGLMLPYGCLAGSCGTCKIEIFAGAENLKLASAIEQNTLDSIYQHYPDAQGKILRLACRAKTNGDVKFTPFTGKAVKK